MDSVTENSEVAQKLGNPVFLREPLMAGLIPHDESNEGDYELAGMTT